MSETVHYIGKLKEVICKNNESIEDIAKRILEIENHEIESYYDSAIECIEDFFYKKYVIISNKIFHVDMIKINPCDDIMKSFVNQDGTISFEVKYYNGGCSFDEAIERALKNLKKDR